MISLYRWDDKTGSWIKVGTYFDEAQALAKQKELDDQGVENILMDDTHTQNPILDDRGQTLPYQQIIR